MSDTAMLIVNARVLTLAGPAGPRTGADLADLGVLDRGWVLVDNGTIARVEPGEPGEAETARAGRTIDAQGRVLMPSFVDAHTHACWAGDRLDEWERKLGGATYLELLQAGGGIMATVGAVRGASEDELAERLSTRLGWMLAEGTTTVEVKSGYGLTTADELKMLGAISRAGRCWPGTVVPTACIGHAKDPGQADFVGRTINETLPAVHEAYPSVAIDAYCERGAWSLDETIALMTRARALGHPIRVHADQFNALGVTPWAGRSGALSVDHLEATPPDQLAALARSETFGVMLPCSGFQVDGRYADGRGFVDAGGRLVVATNCNPGSAPTSSMPMAIALAVRHLGITTSEAIAACTINAAALLGLGDRGRIVPGQRADLVLLRWTDERQLGYEFGGNPVDLVVCRGTPIGPCP